jgi:hypothetical protein
MAVAVATALWAVVTEPARRIENAFATLDVEYGT